MISFPPGLILVIGALFLPLIRRVAGAMAMGWAGIGLGLATMAAVWMVPADPVQVGFLDDLLLTPVTTAPLGTDVTPSSTLPPTRCHEHAQPPGTASPRFDGTCHQRMSHMSCSLPGSVPLSRALRPMP